MAIRRGQTLTRIVTFIDIFSGEWTIWCGMADGHREFIGRASRPCLRVLIDPHTRAHVYTLSSPALDEHVLVSSVLPYAMALAAAAVPAAFASPPLLMSNATRAAVQDTRKYYHIE